jgi:tetratricopeptide (TPR) repeat protein
VREQAIKSLEPGLKQGGNEITAALKPMLNDPVRNVRVAAAWALRTSLDTNTVAGKDLIVMLNFNADQPVGQYHKAMFCLDRGEPARALTHLQIAEKWDPFAPPIRLEEAEVLSELGRTNEALREVEVLRRLDPNFQPPQDLLRRLAH